MILDCVCIEKIVKGFFFPNFNFYFLLFFIMGVLLCRQTGLEFTHICLYLPDDEITWKHF